MAEWRGIEDLHRRYPRVRFDNWRWRVPVPDDAMIGAGTVVYWDVRIGEDVVIGANCVIHSGCVIGKGSEIADDVYIDPNTTIPEGMLVTESIRDSTRVFLPGFFKPRPPRNAVLPGIAVLSQVEKALRAR